MLPTKTKGKQQKVESINKHRHIEQEQDDSYAKKKSYLSVKRTKKISDEDKFDDSDATNK